MLFFYHLPSSEDWLEDHNQKPLNTPPDREEDEQHIHERVEHDNSQAGPSQRRDSFTATLDTADGILDHGFKGVLVQSSRSMNSSANERTVLLTESIAHHSQQTSNGQCSSNNTILQAQRAKSLCLWPCRVVQNIVSHQLWGFTQLMWDEVVVVLYGIFIMTTLKTAIQVSQDI